MENYIEAINIEKVEDKGFAVIAKQEIKSGTLVLKGTFKVTCYLDEKPIPVYPWPKPYHGNDWFDYSTLLQFFNHSCAPNAEFLANIKGEYEIISTSKIKIGEEICIDYLNDPNFNKSTKLQSVKSRREFYSNMGFFDSCFCDLCQNEEITNNDCKWTYDKIDELEEESNKLSKELTQEIPKMPKNSQDMVDIIENRFKGIQKMVSIKKQMYNIFKNQKMGKLFLLSIINDGYRLGMLGYNLAKKFLFSAGPNVLRMKFFKEECEKFAKVGEQICKTFRHSEISGYATSWAEWKKRHEDFEAFFQSVHGIVEPISCSHHEDQSHVGVSLSGKEFTELMGWKSDGQ